MAYSLAEAVHFELVIKKSRFLATVQSVPNRARAQEIVQQLRSEHPGARHVCWALMAGGESAAVDDGEPSGTAGRPMLEVLRHQELEGVLATVVRYFGGIKLGAGGLVRAYTDAVAQALLQAEKIPMREFITQQCQLPYDLEGWLRRCLQECGAQLMQVEHQALVRMQWELPKEEALKLTQRINDDAQGRIAWIERW